METLSSAPWLLANYYRALKHMVTSRHVTRKNKSKFLLRSLLHWRYVAAFFSGMKALQCDFMLERYPRLLEKFSRPYLSTETTSPQTLEVLSAHYHLLRQCFTQAALEEMYGEGLSLCHFTLDGEAFECTVEYDGRFEKEGELCISLRQCVTRQRVYALVIVLSEKAAFIGCLQGGKQQEDTVRRITKASHGLRPHNLLFFVTQALTQALGCKTLYGVSSSAHIYQASTRTRTRHPVSFDYDRFWGELGGARVATWYALPTTYHRHLLEDIPSKKRMLYRRRYALMDSLLEDITATLIACTV